MADIIIGMRELEVEDTKPSLADKTFSVEKRVL